MSTHTARLSRRRFIQATRRARGRRRPAVRAVRADRRRWRLVVVVLRGALDGLAAVPPHGDPTTRSCIGNSRLRRPDAPDGALALDGTFGLHPSLQFLHERYLARELVVFHAVASPYRDRSHFDGQNVLENGLTHPSARRTAG